MSEKVERYAKEYAKEYAKVCVDENTVKCIKSLMESMDISFEDAIKALKINKKQAEKLKEAVLGVESI